MERKSDRNDGNRGEARSNEHEGGRLDFLRKVYMSSHAAIEAKFLVTIGARNLSMKDKEFSLMSFREGAVEMLSAIERVFGAEGLRDVSRYLKVREKPIIDHEDGEEEEDDGGGEDDYIPTPPDSDFNFENCDPAHVRPWEKLENDKFPFELVDKEEEPSGPEPEDEEEDEDEEEELELDIIERVANWDEVRGLWKDYDPAYR